MELNQFRDVDLVIDKANDNFIQRQFVSQGDYKGRTLTVQVTDNGLIGQVPGLMLNLRWRNQASGAADLSAFECIDVENSVFRIEYPQNMLTPGKVVANIQVIQNGKVTHLKSFELTVQNLAGEMTGIVEQAEYGALVAVLADANKFRTDIDTLVMDKADKKDVVNITKEVDGLASGKVDKGGTSQITWPMIAQDVRDQMLGDTPPAIVGPGSVLNESIVEGSISPLKTDFIKTGKNLYDKRKIIDGYYLDRNNGTLAAYASNFVTDYIYVGPNLPVSINILNSNLVGAINYCIYGLDKVRLRGGQLTSTSANPLEMGEDGFYLRFSAYKDYKDSLQVEIGETSTDFQDFYLVLDEKIKVEQEVITDIFDPTEIGLTVRPSGFDVYIKGSESAGNQYFKYPIEKAQKEYISGDLSSNYDTLNIVSGYKATRENNLFSTGLQIIQYGEWEMAIKENGATDFVGGMTHGDEILTTYAAFFDGKYIEFGESQTLFGKEFIIESHSDFYRDTSITNGELLKLGKHYKKYVFNKDGLTLTQKIEWATDVTLSNCYLCMLPIKRKINNDNTGDNITTNAMTAELINYDISEANWIGDLRTPLQGRKRINIWGETSGISAYIENKATPDLSDGLGFVQNTLTYNKYYFDFSGGVVVHTGDVWENVTTIKIDVKEP